jgi:serine/threonine protein kinase
MAITKGARRIFDWLKNQKAGTIVSYDEVMNVAKWSESSLDTYLDKNKLAPFLQPLQDRRLKVLMDGSEISPAFFDETFSQKGPGKIAVSAGDLLRGEIGTYELLEPLGHGAVGRVWSAKSTADTTTVAVKLMLPRQELLQESILPNVRERFSREARYGRALKHPNIIRHLDVGEIEKNPFLVMELAEGSVADQIRKSGAIPEEEAAEIVEYCLNGLDYLHGKGCPHRDVKPANLLEFAETIKLGDLGIVKWSDFDPTFTKGATITRQSVQLGSWFYMAPEQQESPHDAVPASDLYALAVSWIEILVGVLPSPQAIGASAYRLPPIDEQIVALIKRMHSYDPSDRPPISEILEIIHATYK